MPTSPTAVPLARRLCAAGTAAVLALVGAACGGDDDEASERFEKAKEAAEMSTTTAEGQPSTTAAAGEPSDQPTTTAAPAALPPSETLLAAVAAFNETPGAPIRALQLTTHFPVGDTGYASLQYQVPGTANVDNRDWRNNEVGEASPVQLSGDGSLEENLFGFDEVNWAAIAAALPGAPALVEQQMGTTFENSDGVTHIIAEKDLPFSANTVVRVYVDGGDRTSGGYVQYLADGTLEKVMA